MADELQDISKLKVGIYNVSRLMILSEYRIICDDNVLNECNYRICFVLSHISGSEKHRFEILTDLQLLGLRLPKGLLECRLPIFVFIWMCVTLAHEGLERFNLYFVLRGYRCAANPNIPVPKISLRIDYKIKCQFS
jgi:hypothetical protein